MIWELGSVGIAGDHNDGACINIDIGSGRISEGRMQGEHSGCDAWLVCTRGRRGWANEGSGRVHIIAPRALLGFV